MRGKRHPVEVHRRLRPGRPHLSMSGINDEPDSFQSDPPGCDRVGPTLGEQLLLDGADPAHLPDHPLLVAAAIGHCERVMDPALRLAWAQYAYRVAAERWEPDEPLRLRAMLLYGQALSQRGRVLDAYRIHRTRLTILEEVGDPDESVSGRRHLAGALHAISHCDEATTAIHHALTSWLAGDGPEDEGVHILADYAMILAGCGRTRAALQLLAAHPQLLPASEDRDTLALRIASKACTHPPICRRHPTGRPPQRGIRQLTASWQRLLHAAPVLSHLRSTESPGR